MTLGVMNYSGWYGDFDGTGWKPYVITTNAAGTAANFSANNADGVAVSATADKQGAIDYNYMFNGTSWDRMRKPSATARLVASAATTNAGVAKAAAGDLVKVHGFKATAGNCFLKIYNKATAPTVGTDTPVLTIALPASSVFNLDFSSLYFSAGIAYAITANAADADTTAIAANDVLGLNFVMA